MNYEGERHRQRGSYKSAVVEDVGFALETSLLGGDKCTSGLAAAVLDFWCEVRANNIDVSTTEKFDLENIEAAVGILFLRSIEIKILHAHENC